MSNYLCKESFYGSCRPEPFAQRYRAKRCFVKFCKIHVKHLCRSLFFNKFAGSLVRTSFLWNSSQWLLLAGILVKSYSESFLKNFPETPLNALKTPIFKNNVADSVPETLQKRNLSEYVFVQILRIFQNNLSLKNFVRLPLDGVYLFCKNASPKYVQNFAKNMWLM